MKKNSAISIHLDEHGHLILPEEILKQYGLSRGSQIRAEMSEHGFVIHRSTAALARVYIEPTNACNLDCATCMRNAWDEPLGRMSIQTFARIMEGILSFTPLPSVFFGGYGEPLAHADIFNMVAGARQAGLEVELITNGTLLDESAARQLLNLGLNRLWVSIDGATPESYSDVRLGAELPKVIANLTRLKELHVVMGSEYPKLGIAFVAMKENIADLPEVIRLGKSLGADIFSVSGVLPHTRELQDEILYKRSLEDGALQPSKWSPIISLPRTDPDESLIKSLVEIFELRTVLEIARQPVDLGINKCPFVEKGSISIRWDGAVSPCLSLLHTHTSYLGENLRTSFAYTIGSVQEKSLQELWYDPGYVRLRERLQAFDFSPCTFCNSCQMAESNVVDCFGNDQPVCGGCLWAQGFIQCP